MKLTPRTRFSHHRRARSGFTLIELLVVVSIIALLAGGAVGGYGKVMNTVKKAAAQKVCVEVCGAIASFASDYDRLPISTSGGGTASDEEISDTADGQTFLGVLAAAKDTDKENPRHLNYIDGMQQAKTNAGRPINGINYEDNEAAPSLYDPWGKGYKLILDADFDGEIENPERSGGSSNVPAKIRGKKAIMWGAGPDGDYDTWSDNVKSW